MFVDNLKLYKEVSSEPDYKILQCNVDGSKKAPIKFYIENKCIHFAYTRSKM